jgi:hypothetical protein
VKRNNIWKYLFAALFTILTTVHHLEFCLGENITASLSSRVIRIPMPVQRVDRLLRGEIRGDIKESLIDGNFTIEIFGRYLAENENNMFLHYDTAFVAVRIYRTLENNEKEAIASFVIYPGYDGLILEISQRKQEGNPVEIGSVASQILGILKSYTFRQKEFEKFNIRTFEQLESRLSHILLFDYYRTARSSLEAFILTVDTIKELCPYEINPHYIANFLFHREGRLEQFRNHGTYYNMIQELGGYDELIRIKEEVEAQTPPLFREEFVNTIILTIQERLPQRERQLIIDLLYAAGIFNLEDLTLISSDGG